MPVIGVGLLAIMGIKAAGLAVGFAPAGAEDTQTFAVDQTPEAPPAPRRDSEEAILSRLAARQEELDAREEAISTREKLLIAAEKAVDEKLAVLAQERAVFADAERDEDAARRAEFETLSKTYERMKPKDAARILENLGDDILIPVAAGMRTQSLAGVLAEMEPKKASALTRALADKSYTESTPR